jgi:hypothetical protein
MVAGLPVLSRWEYIMEHLAGLGEFFGGLGLFFTGMAAFWFVSVYEKKGKE